MTEPREVELELGWVRTDGGTQMREEISESHASDLIAHLDRIPPAVVFYDGSQYWLADGWHRLLAHSMAGKTHIRCLVYQGTLREALLHAAGANADHGLKRTRKEAERAVRAVLSDPEWAEWSDHTVADMCRVSADTVGSVRRKMAAEDPGSVPPLDAPRKGRDGRTRPAKPRATQKTDNGEAPADPQPTSGSEMRDQLGQPIPERLRDVFADPFLKDTARQLRALENTVKDVAARWAKHLILSDNGHHRGILRALEDAYEGIEAGIPYAVHKRCGGKGCHGKGTGCHGKGTGCHGTGYVTRRLYEYLRNEEEW